MFSSHVLRGTGALVISALLDFLTFALCAPYSETTHGEHFDSLLEMVATHGRAMFKLFQVQIRSLYWAARELNICVGKLMRQYARRVDHRTNALLIKRPKRQQTNRRTQPP